MAPFASELPSELFMRHALCLSLVLVALSAEGGQPVPPVPTRLQPSPVAIPVVDGVDLRVTRLSTRDGLSQTRVSQIAQDDAGFMWFGTQYGLNRYDGYTFKVYRHDPRRVESLGGVYIYSLFKDRSGALWVGCDQSLDRFDPATESFVHYRVVGDVPGEHLAIRHISQDRRGMLWLATDQGLFSLDPTDGTITRHRSDPADASGLSDNTVKFTGEDRAGRFWVANGDGLDEFDRTTGKVVRRVPLGEATREVRFHEDGNGVFWITYNPNGGTGGIAILDREANRLTKFAFAGPALGGGLTGVYDMLESRDGTLWFATMGNGVLKFDRAGRRFIRYRNDPRDPESIAENRAIALFEDREGHIWSGFHATEPNFFTPRPALFERLPLERHIPDSLGERMVNAIFVDRAGIVWLGTGGGLMRVDRQAVRYTFYRTPGPGMSTDVLALAEARPGVLSVGTLVGFTEFDVRTGWVGAARRRGGPDFSLAGEQVTQVLVDRTGVLWATSLSGLRRFDAAQNRFNVVQSASYVGIVEDRHGDLWLPTSNAGLHRFTPSTGAVRVYRHQSGVSGSLSDNRVNSVFVDDSGILWAGTQNGLDRFDANTQTFTAFTERDGLPSSAVSCILEDRNQALWLSTNMGISRFEPRQPAFQNFSTPDGVPGDLTGWGTCFKSADGEMFFGGFSGVIAFHPEDIVESAYVPPIVLTDFRLAGTSVAVAEGSPLRRGIAYTDALVLTPQQNMFSLEFAALSYSDPMTNRYRYRLEGLDPGWHEVSANERLASYTTLPPGSYTFRVQGATSRGPWGEPGLVLRLDVLPPWWQTWWFRATGLAVLLTCAWFLHHSRLRRLAWQSHVRLEERVNERTRIARDLHDTLLQSFQGLILLFQAADDLLPARPDEAKKKLERALDRAQDAVTEGRDAVQELRGSHGLDLAQAIKALGQELTALVTAADGAPVPSFQVVAEGAARSVPPLVVNELSRIAFEAVRNAFRHAGARAIEVEIVYGETRFRLRVRDDGKGIGRGVLHTARRAGRWGVSGMRERARLIGADFDVWSRPGAGTEVEVSLPAAIAYATATSRSELAEGDSSPE